MVRRGAVLVAGLALLASCSTTGLARSEVPDVVRGAFRAAGVDATSVSVAGGERDGRWPVEAVVSGDRVPLQVDGEAGRIAGIDLRGSDAISSAQLREIAAYSSNPSDERSQRVRRTVVLIAVLGAVGAGLLLARRQRLREASERQPEAASSAP